MDTKQYIITLLSLVFLIGFNVYMNLYNNHQIAELTNKVTELENLEYPKIDTMYISQKDSTYIISWYRY